MPPNPLPHVDSADVASAGLVVEEAAIRSRIPRKSQVHTRLDLFYMYCVGLSGTLTGSMFSDVEDTGARVQ
jgi:hypothetical protein